MRIRNALAHQRDLRIRRNAYELIQCYFAYHSNRIEGSALTYEQTTSIYVRGVVSATARVDDINETRKHFDLLDFVIDHANEPITSEMVKRMHAILKRATSAERNPYQVVGGFKVFENEIEGTITRTKTALPSEVPGLVDELFRDYESADHGSEVFLSTIAEFHWRFERIHPFSDGNGRIGRALLFRECLRRDESPIIVTEDMRDFYIRGLRNTRRNPDTSPTRSALRRTSSRHPTCLSSKTTRRRFGSLTSRTTALSIRPRMPKRPCPPKKPWDGSCEESLTGAHPFPASRC